MTTSNEHNNAPAVQQGWKPVQTPITEEMHIAAVKVLHRATGLAGLPQRVLDAMLAATPAPSAPAVPQGETVAWMVYGNYTRRPFGMLSSAEAYMRGLLKSDPDGGYHIRPLRYTTPSPAPAQERCSTCGYLTSEREHLGCLRRAVKDLDIATGGPYDAQEVGTTTDAIHAGLWRHAVRKGVVTVHTECMDDRNPGTKCSWIQGHDKAADVSNEAAALRAKGQS